MSFIKIFETSFVIAALVIFLGFNSLFTGNAIALTTANIQEKYEFQQLIEQTHAAWNSHNSDALSEFYDKDADLIFYDALPMQYQGWNNYKQGIQENLFDKMPKFILSANDDLHLTLRDDLAWTTFTWHLSAELNDGTPIETDGRQTDIWEKSNGEWEIVHEHISAPVSL
ncbi:MAG: nuclear transport factor 2 family protein [Cyanobacteria bacterium P01_E01_bin.35]